MTDLTDEAVKAMLNLLRSETEAASRTDAADMIEALHAELAQARAIINGKTFTVDEAQELVAQARADAKAAVGLAIERADFEVQKVSDNCETDGERLAIMAAVSAIRALAPEDAIAEVERLRAELDAWTETARLHLNAEQAFLSWLREAGEHMRAEGVTVCDDGVDSGDILAAKVAECAALLKADRDRLAAELAAANAREAGLRALLINRDGGSHDEDCKARRYANSDGLCNCGHDGVVAALAQFSTGGGA